MKITPHNDPVAQYETNEWGEFGYWLRDRSYFENGRLVKFMRMGTFAM